MSMNSTFKFFNNNSLNFWKLIKSVSDVCSKSIRPHLIFYLFLYFESGKLLPDSSEATSKFEEQLLFSYYCTIKYSVSCRNVFLICILILLLYRQCNNLEARAQCNSQQRCQIQTAFKLNGIHQCSVGSPKETYRVSPRICTNI